MKTEHSNDRSRRTTTLRADGVRWSVRGRSRRIVAVGDVHGDITALAAILLDRDLIDKKGSWTGEDTQLVLNGDLVGGKDSRILLEFILDLRKDAREHGGYVHSLLGNHDILVFSKNYQKREGKTLFRKAPVEGAEKGTIRDAFTGDTKMAEWLRMRNAALRIGDTIFTHAGLNLWALEHHIKRVNATARAWIRYWQGESPEPDPSSEWVVSGPEADWSASSVGPLWTRSFKVPARKSKRSKRAQMAPEIDDLKRILRKYRATRMVVAHSPSPENRVVLEHPYYGDMVVMIDTKISDAKNGRLSCIEIQDGAVQACYPCRSKSAEKLRERELKKLQA